MGGQAPSSGSGLLRKLGVRRKTGLLTTACLLRASTAAFGSQPVSAKPVELCSRDIKVRDRLQSDDGELNRELLGVAAAHEDALEVRFGLAVTAVEAVRLDEMQAVRDEVNVGELRLEAEKLLGDDLVSVTWSYVDGFEIRVKASSAALLANAAELTATFGLAEDRYTVVKVGENVLSESARREAMESLSTPEATATLTDLGVAMIGTDDRCGRIEVGLAPGTNLGRAQSGLKDMMPVAAVDIAILDEADIPNDTVGRGTYEATISGGHAYVVSGFVCTSAAPWYKTSGGVTTKYAVTAAHCVPQSHWASPPQYWMGYWWLTTTTSDNVTHGGVTIATATARIAYGAGLEAVIWPLASWRSGSPRTATNTDAHSYRWWNLGWWTWEAFHANSGANVNEGGDAVGDYVCQSGVTTARRAPSPAWNQDVIECGILTDRSLSYSNGGSWFYGMRWATTNVCEGDSGGTVWRGGWYTGIAATGTGVGTPIYGTPCHTSMTYSHVRELRDRFGLTAPVGFS